MKTRSTLIAISLAIVLAAAACTSTSDDSADTTIAAPASTTTSEAIATTTTTAPPVGTVSVAGDVDEDVAATVGAFLSVVNGLDDAASPQDQDLLEHLSGLTGQLADSYTMTATTEDLTTGGSVGVVALETGDVILIADEGGGWAVVGADMGSFNADPWFGPSSGRVLVLGSDARPGETPGTSRTDSIHIVTAVPSEAAGTILGFPRDSYVSTPYGDMRINAITTSGRGPEAVFDFFTDEWEIPLDGYVLTAFEGFEDLVDAAVGLLEINLPKPVPSIKYWDGFPEGEQTLTPTRTLDLARTRKGLPGGDFTRSFNQGLIMSAVLTMFQQGSVEDVPMLVGELTRYTETNLTPTRLVQLGASAFSLDIASIDNIVLPGKLGRAPGGASVVFLTPEAEDIIADVIDDGLLTPTDE